MLQIKVCGITNIDDALAVASAGADAIGLNFYRRSPRFVGRDAALEIVAALPDDIVKVGVFVDTPATEICDLFDTLPLDLIQLHGDQPPEFVGQLGGRPTMKAFRIGPEISRVGTAHHDTLNHPAETTVGHAHPTKTATALQFVAEYLASCRTLGAPLEMAMLDALVAGQFGGTGNRVDWSVARAYVKEIGAPPLVLAGGLSAESVGDAIRAVRPAAVDVASGVESSPGCKDHAAVAAFVQAARAEFAA